MFENIVGINLYIFLVILLFTIISFLVWRFQLKRKLDVDVTNHPSQFTTDPDEVNQEEHIDQILNDDIFTESEEISHTLVPTRIPTVQATRAPQKLNHIQHKSNNLQTNEITLAPDEVIDHNINNNNNFDINGEIPKNNNFLLTNGGLNCNFRNTNNKPFNNKINSNIQVEKDILLSYANYPF